MKKIIVLVIMALMTQAAYADGWHGGRWHREGWHGGDRWGWALGVGLVGGLIGSALVPRAPVYVQPAPVVVPPPVVMQPAPAVVMQPGYYPAYPAPYYYYGR
jgi:hypothetical protein